MMKKYILLAACTLGLSLDCHCQAVKISWITHRLLWLMKIKLFLNLKKWLMLRMLCWVTAGILIRSICSLTVM